MGSNVAESLLARGDDVVIVDEMNDYYDVRIKENNLQRLRDKFPEEKRLLIHRGDIWTKISCFNCLRKSALNGFVTWLHVPV